MDMGTREAFAYWLEENHNIVYEDFGRLSTGRQSRLWNGFKEYLANQDIMLLVGLD